MKVKVEKEFEKITLKEKIIIKFLLEEKICYLESDLIQFSSAMGEECKIAYRNMLNDYYPLLSKITDMIK